MAGIYIHIPFCRTRCIYCDFYSTTQSELKEKYIRSLRKELEMRKDYLDNEPIETIYFGGGTPSQLNREDFEMIFATIRQYYDLNTCHEVTLEANPDDLRPDYLKALSMLPFNRISIGIQTFSDVLLKRLNRRHNSEQAIQAVKDCRTYGYSNLSIDLIYGLPGENTERWKQDLEQAICLDIPHISAYHLIYEEGTPIYNMLKKHQIEEVEEESSVHFFSMLMDQLATAGYEHYEISNFCKPGMYSRHNTSYWTGTKYMGCGPSAHSFNGREREWNGSSIEDYIRGIEANQRIYETEYLDKVTRYNEFIITSIRTMWGVSLQQMESEFGSELTHYCMKMARPYLKSGKLEKYGHSLRLTREGIFISDGIMSDLLWVEY